MGLRTCGGCGLCGVRGPGSARLALSGGVWFALLGGGVVALRPGASLVCELFPLGSFWRQNNQRSIALLCLKFVYVGSLGAMASFMTT